MSSLALPAFVASAASTLSLQDDILAGCVKSDSDILTSCLSVWSEKFGDIPDVLPTKQPFWDRPGVLEDKVLVDSSMNSAHHRASFLAASSQHSGDWLFALPIASCGLRLDDEAVRVAVGLRLVWMEIPFHFFQLTVHYVRGPGGGGNFSRELYSVTSTAFRHNSDLLEIAARNAFMHKIRTL